MVTFCLVALVSSAGQADGSNARFSDSTLSEGVSRLFADGKNSKKQLAPKTWPGTRNSETCCMVERESRAGFITDFFLFSELHISEDDWT